MIRALSTQDGSPGENQQGSLVTLAPGQRHAPPAGRPLVAVEDPDEGPTLLEASIGRPKVLLASAILFGIVGLLLVAAKWSSYHASARVILRDPWEADIGATDRPVGGDFQRFVRSQARFMQTDDVLAIAAESAGISKSELASGLLAVASPSGDFVEVSMGASSPQEATRRLDAVLRAYGTQRMEAVEEQSTAVLDSIAAEVARVKADPNSDLASKATNLRIAVAAYGNGISFVEESDATADMGLTKKLGIPLAAALAGVGLAAVAVWIQANRYPVVRNPEALANQRGLAFLGTVATTDGAVASSADRVATEATLLALAGSLRKQPPRGTNSAYVVVLAAGSAEAKTLAVSKFLAEATEAHGALARVIDVDGRHGPLDGIDVQTELSGPRCDLLLFACGTPQKDFTALKLARDADAIVVVVAQNADAAEVTQGLTFFENVGQYPDAVIATKHTKAGR